MISPKYSYYDNQITSSYMVKIYTVILLKREQKRSVLFLVNSGEVIRAGSLDDAVSMLMKGKRAS